MTIAARPCLVSLVLLLSLEASGNPAARPLFFKTKLGGNSGTLGDLPSFSQMAFGPDGLLYATRSEPGEIRRFRVDQDGLPVAEELLLNQAQAGNLVNGLAFDPAATAANLVFYYSQCAGGGKVYRVKAGPWGGTRILEQTLLIDKIGIMGNHSINNLAFGKNGRLYLTLAGQSYSGNNEKPWTAAIAEADLSHPAFRSLPVLISSPDVLGDAVHTGSEPIRLFATGLRNPHGLLQHSNGHLYGTIHDPDDRDDILTPDGTGMITSATTYIPDLLARIERGRYYGHTNAPRKEFVYFGGNPTAAVDPFEVPELPVGTRTAMDLDLVQGVDHHMCIAGLDEYADGNLLVTYVKERSKPIGRVEWFDLDKDGRFVRPPMARDTVVRHDYLRDQDGKVLEFGGVMDVLATPQGWIYVADFGHRAGNGGTGDIAGLYLLKPTVPVASRRPAASPPAPAFAWKGNGIEAVLREPGYVSVTGTDLGGRTLHTLFAGPLPAGTHLLPVARSPWPAGIALVRIRMSGRRETLKVPSLLP